LRIIVSSATIDAAVFKNYFSSGKEKEDGKGQEDNTVAAISLEGRTFPVDVMYLDDPTEDYIEAALTTVLDIHTKEPQGDILLFLTGRDEIETCVAAINERVGRLPSSTPKLNAWPLYAGLPTSEQMAVFQPAQDGERKVVVATNVAEASVTIDGIVYVIDCGFAKVLATPHTETDTADTSI